MKLLNKYKAFTILELVVVLALSSIVMATVYSIYLIVQKQYNRYYGRTASVETYIRLKRDMGAQFLVASQVSYSPDSTLLTCKTKTAFVRYIFRDTYVLREATNGIDTFDLESRELSVTSPGKVNLLIDTFRCQIYLGKDTLNLQMEKHYSAEQIINLTENEQ